jgi:ABC-type sugar transport system ATPase subunit
VTPTTPALLQMTGIVKELPGVQALDGVDLDVRAGEVHCLLGQNGAGKSTMIKVLSGFHQPDEGTITWDGEEVAFSTPAKAIEHGLGTIYQELDLTTTTTTVSASSPPSRTRAATSSSWSVAPARPTACGTCSPVTAC